jgi:hypothetical protein
MLCKLALKVAVRVAVLDTVHVVGLELEAVHPLHPPKVKPFPGAAVRVAEPLVKLA